ncbi:hypothetical protein [Streptomyces sp. NPDC005485]|uniref:hypothetical protein n=1 Tax=Streptomyces sp. NPDC005485 TaxID=3155591 RepID=UPI0033B30E9E
MERGDTRRHPGRRRGPAAGPRPAPVPAGLAGRFFPNMPGDLVLERVLGAEETAQWFTQVAPAKG